MRWQWLALSVVMACRIDLESPSQGHLIQLATTTETPQSMVIDDHLRLWGLFSTQPWVRFFDGSGWAGNGAWGTAGGQALAADVGGDIVVGRSGQVSRLRYEPTDITDVGPTGPSYVMSLAALSDGELAVFWGLSLQWWRPGMDAWSDTHLTSNHYPWITPNHELVDVMSNGELVRIADPSNPEILAAGLDVTTRPAGIDPAGDAVVYNNNSQTFRVSKGVVTPIALEAGDTLVRVIATSKHVVAAVKRTTGGVEREILVALSDDGTWIPIVQDGDMAALTAVTLRATPAGDIYVFDGGFVGRIDF